MIQVYAMMEVFVLKSPCQERKELWLCQDRPGPNLFSSMLICSIMCVVTNSYLHHLRGEGAGHSPFNMRRGHEGH